MSVDHTGRIQHVSGALMRLFSRHASSISAVSSSWQASNLVGQTLPDLSRRSQPSNLLTAGLSGIEGELRVGPLLLGIRVLPQVDDQGKVQGRVLIWQDLGAERDAAEKAENWPLKTGGSSKPWTWQPCRSGLPTRMAPLSTSTMRCAKC